MAPKSSISKQTKTMAGAEEALIIGEPAAWVRESMSYSAPLTQGH